MNANVAAIAAKSHSEQRVILEGIIATAEVLRDLFAVADRIAETDFHGSLLCAADHYFDEMSSLTDQLIELR